MKYYVLFNPLAGKGNTQEDLTSLSTCLEGEFVYQDITAIGDYASFLSTLGTNDAIILCGGDGTLNRFINDTDGLAVHCDILYCPRGTGNDFLHDLGRQPDEKPFSVKQYLQNLPTVEVNGKTYRFLNNVGFGIDGYCSEVGDEMKKQTNKPVNYTAIAIKGLLFHYKPTAATVTVDGQEYRYRNVWLAPTMKGRFYGGGMIPTPAQDRTDPEGTLSVMIFCGKSRLKTLMIFPSIFKGEHVKHEKVVSVHTGKDIHVSFDSPASLQIDGETIVGVTEYRAYATQPAVVANV